MFQLRVDVSMRKKRKPVVSILAGTAILTEREVGLSFKY
jgi:hypothetical protein